MAEKLTEVLCEHSYVYGGVRYLIGHQLAGGNAKRREYFDWYFCWKCRHKEYELLEHHDDTYDELKFGATPFPKGASV